MKAVIANVSDNLLQERRRTGADRWDEIWNGVLHMPPAPNREHQRLEFQLESWLYNHWAQPQGNEVYHQINLASHGGWPNRDYRVPDLVLLTPDRSHIDHNEYFEGAPLVVIELRSPDDESYEKLKFYARLGVPEVWIIDRDTRAPELYALAGSDYTEQTPDAAGLLRSAATGITLQGLATNQIALWLTDDESTRGVIPE